MAIAIVLIMAITAQRSTNAITLRSYSGSTSTNNASQIGAVRIPIPILKKRKPERRSSKVCVASF
jgi:hypothetical protein